LDPCRSLTTGRPAFSNPHGGTHPKDIFTLTLHRRSPCDVGSVAIEVPSAGDLFKDRSREQGRMVTMPTLTYRVSVLLVTSAVSIWPVSPGRAQCSRTPTEAQPVLNVAPPEPHVRRLDVFGEGQFGAADSTPSS